MDGLELVSVVVLFFVGFWVISAVWPAKWTRKDEPPGGAGDSASGDDASRTPKDPS